MTCSITNCNRDTEDTYCFHHSAALNNLHNAFSKWQFAFGKKITMEDFLDKLVSNTTIDCGNWVKDVAKILLDQDN